MSRPDDQTCVKIEFVLTGLVFAGCLLCVLSDFID